MVLVKNTTQSNIVVASETGPFTFKSGLNFIADAKWTALQEIEKVSDRVDSGVLVEIELPVDVKGEPALTNFELQSAVEQLETLIGEVSDSIEPAIEAAVSEITSSVYLEATGTLTQAQILGMFAEPVVLIPAYVEENAAIVVDEVQICHVFEDTAYDDGGDISITYGGGGDEILALDVSIVDGGDTSEVVAKPNVYDRDDTTGDDAGFGLEDKFGVGIVVTNATEPFSAGHADNVVHYRIRYHLVQTLEPAE